MKCYLIQQTSQKGNSYKRVILKATNDLTGEEIYFSGFYEEFAEPKQWGKEGQLLGFAEIGRDKNSEKK